MVHVPGENDRTTSLPEDVDEPGQPWKNDETTAGEGRRGRVQEEPLHIHHQQR